MGTYLYGIGPRTEKYIVEHPDLVIDGILDGYRNDGEFCGIPVLALGDISTQNSRIIVAARPASARIIHARIKEFCMERNVEIYDINGRRMENGEDVRRPEAEKIRVDTDKLHREIERHDVVSFDIFYPLLVRKCGAAEKVFAYVAIKNGLSGGFVGERIRAEKELSQTMAPKIEDIYRTLSERMQIPQEEGRRLLLEEIEAEKKFLVIREKLAEAFSYAQAKGKKIFLISDMYLSRKVLGQILSEKGIEGYDRLFVSCEHGTDKAGKLFHEALRKAEGKDMLHIGDDEYRDCECAERCGRDTFPGGRWLFPAWARAVLICALAGCQAEGGRDKAGLLLRQGRVSDKAGIRPGGAGYGNAKAQRAGGIKIPARIPVAGDGGLPVGGRGYPHSRRNVL